MDKNYFMIKELLKNEKFVKKLEIIDEELKRTKENKSDFSFIVPILFLILENLRTSKTAFPTNFFNKTKIKTK
jgi:hypothetical protein